MGADAKDNRKLLDYQLSDFLELKLKHSEKKLISKVKQGILNTSGFEGPNLYEFPAIGTPSACVILPNGFSKKLKKLCLIKPDGSLKVIPLR